MIKFNSIIIENFMSIGEAQVDLATGGFTLISAINNRVEDSASSNGSGKSSIAEAIVWVLTGETIRGHKEVVNRYTEGNCKVEISFEFRGRNWVVRRGMTRSKEKSLVIYKDGQELAAKGYRDAVEVFSRELPELTFKFINSVVILGQGLPGRFTNNSPAGRKAVLEELTNADFMITQIKEGIKLRNEVLQEGLRKQEDQKVVAETMITAGTEALNRDRETLSKLSEFDLVEAEKSIAELEVKLEETKRTSSEVLGKANEALSFLEEVKKQKSDKERERDSKISLLREELGERKAALVKEIAEEKEAELAVIQERLQKGDKLIREVDERLRHNEAIISGGTCKLCGQRIKSVTEEALAEAKKAIEVDTANLSKYQTLYRELKDQWSKIKGVYASKERAFVESETEEYNRRIDKLLKSYEEALEVASTEVNQAKLAAEALMGDKSSLDEEISVLTTKLTLAKEKVANHQERVEEVKSSILSREEGVLSSKTKLEEALARIEDYKNRLTIVKQMETFASRDFRGILLEGVIDRMNTLVGNYSELVYGNRLTNFYLDGNSICIEFDGKEYESLSGGEQQKLNVILQLALRDLIIELTGLSGSILFLDEIFDGLDKTGCEKMIGLFQAIDTSMFVITHRSDSLPIPYDYTLTVIKESNGISHIQRGV